MNADNYPEYFKAYIEKIPEGDPIELLEYGIKETLKSLAMVSEDQAGSSYEEGKWTIKDLVQHMIDSERVFGFRAMSIARGEKGKILGYDHEAYAASASANHRSLKELLEELKRLRSVTVDLFKSFDDEMLQQKGNANGIEISAEQLMYITIGHELHHIHIINSRYL